jgi:hypothetical protein
VPLRSSATTRAAPESRRHAGPRRRSLKPRRSAVHATFEPTSPEAPVRRSLGVRDIGGGESEVSLDSSFGTEGRGH